ncbi:NADH dehydrogenase (ubiquinone) complex I, assembly factor 6-like [Branchiostoma floridae]|uniref:NADH dehydrogenase (Ubiquinone) complex I, assembly factor 6-like n=1 Tax=Branchiostoma floridae TaxID=7739 RepID=A0A9J7MU54_BRAFL|nr:NADH dehydrogenase (ubiquinone) complex I, assembly factor 6-like [Branchiostoma floridae]
MAAQMNLFRSGRQLSVFLTPQKLLPCASCLWRSASTTRQSHGQYCMDLVRKHDYENYLCVLLLPSTAHQAAFAVRAFNVELALVRDSVTDKNIGKMRMQFWKDTLSDIYRERPPQQPVAQELAKVGLHERTSLVSTSTGIKDVHADHAASHIGKAIGICTALRAAPYLANRRRVFLPMDVMMQFGVSQEDIVRGKQDQKVKDVMYEIASLSHSHLEKARSLKKDVPRKAMSAFLPALSCDSYLKKIQKADFNVFDSSLHQRDTLLPLHLLLQKLRRMF